MVTPILSMTTQTVLYVNQQKPDTFRFNNKVHKQQEPNIQIKV